MNHERSREGSVRKRREGKWRGETNDSSGSKSFPFSSTWFVQVYMTIDQLRHSGQRDELISTRHERWHRERQEGEKTHSR